MNTERKKNLLRQKISNRFKVIDKCCDDIAKYQDKLEEINTENLYPVKKALLHTQFIRQ